tara:strand:- start:180 stop:1079 length:900 start_codon:yes stop_codon:yes gene_type:complete
MASSEFIALEHSSGVSVIRIKRPAKKNALTLPMYSAMTAAFAAAEADAAVHVHLWIGDSGIFTAGNDLSAFADPSSDLSIVTRFLDTLRTLQKPLVCGVCGYAVGIGTTALLHADLVYADATAKFKLPFVDLGLVPEAASSYLLPLRVGIHRANRMLMLGETIDGATAERWGLCACLINYIDLSLRCRRSRSLICNVCCRAPPTSFGHLPFRCAGELVGEDDSVAEHALRRAQELAVRAPTALVETKALCRSHDTRVVKEAMQAEAAVFARCLRGPEAAEALQAFAEKRRPDFSVTSHL